MGQDKKIITIALVVLLGVFLQVAFIFADIRDTPNKAVTEFVNAYVTFDRSMADRLCGDTLTVDGVDIVDAYIYKAKLEAKERGYSLWYLKDCLFHPETHTVSMEADKARIAFHALRKRTLRNFFTKEKKNIEAVFNLVLEDGKWKICGNPFDLKSLAEG